MNNKNCNDTQSEMSNISWNIDNYLSTIEDMLSNNEISSESDYEEEEVNSDQESHESLDTSMEKL